MIIGAMTIDNGLCRLLIALFAPLALLAAGSAVADTPNAAPDATQLDQVFARSSLQIATPDARLHSFRVWIADSDVRRARGLMFVKHLDADAGMLFLYPSQQRIAMWMKNTYIPLDMLFVTASGRVAKVVEHTEPQSLTSIESGTDVIAVIELNAGTASKLHLRAGAQVIHPAFARR